MGTCFGMCILQGAALVYKEDDDGDGALTARMHDQLKKNTNTKLRAGTVTVITFLSLTQISSLQLYT